MLSGGCFWGVQGVFEHVKGVTRAVSGYAGGDKKTADYESVSQGDTGHAESVQLTYDPKQISFGHVLQIFFSVALDPTEVDRQGPDQGTQYRSEVFVSDAEQARVARAYIAQLDAAHVFARPIATRVDMLPGVLCRRGLSPGFPGDAPGLPLHRVQRYAESGGAEDGVSRGLSGTAEACCQRQLKSRRLGPARCGGRTRGGSRCRPA
ncbi:MAG: peptide-methionine (S)-S-oxide reductase MsrA [Rhodospirillales bacterium]